MQSRYHPGGSPCSAGGDPGNGHRSVKNPLVVVVTMVITIVIGMVSGFCCGDDHGYWCRY